MNLSRLLVFVCAALPLLANADAQAAPNTKQTFQLLYANLDKALENKDVDTFMSFYSLEYVDIPIDEAVHGYPELRSAVERGSARYKSITYKTTVQSVKAIPTGEIVLIHQHDKNIRDDATTSKEVVIVSDEVDRDFWIRTDKGWKLKQEKTLSRHATRNGVVVK